MNSNHGFVAELASDPWLIEPKRLEALFATLRDVGALASHDPNIWRMGGHGDQIDVRSGLFSDAPLAQSRMVVAKGVADIPVTGILMRSVPLLFRIIGIDATAYSEIIKDVQAAHRDESVKTIRLNVTSPGGQVSGTMEAADVLFAARKDKATVARITDMGASAAYWIASQAETVQANGNSMIGSIGVVTTVSDVSKMASNLGIKVHVVQSGPLKGTGIPGSVVTDDQLAALQDLIDGMAKNFRRAVARGRGVSVEAVAEWASGRVWLAEVAKRMGLIDQIANTARLSAPSDGRAATLCDEEGDHDMPDPKMTAGGADDIRAQAEAQAQERERTRIKDLHAAFPDRPQFVMEQVLKGNSLAQAKAELADVLAAENKTLTDENAELKARAAASKVQPPAAQSKPVAGAPPISQEGAGSQAPAGSFLERATALAKERGITRRQAISVLASEEPELFDKFREKCIAEGPAHADRKRRLGVS